MIERLALLALLLAAATASAWGQTVGVQPAERARIDRALRAAFPTASAAWLKRLVPDETLRTCSTYHNAPPKDVGEAIMKRERATIKYPPDGKLVGDWRRGEKLAQSGYGMRFTDYPPKRENGGNCYACHQISPREESYGSIGVKLLKYGKGHNFGASETKTVYDKLYNSHATVPCSRMPRFGANGILTIDQIKDLVALLMDPESPVNK